MSRSERLKPQHEIFVSALAKGLNQTQAYQKAYPNVGYNTARTCSSQLFANPNISEEVKRRIHRALQHNNVTPEEVIGHAARQMRTSMEDIVDENGNVNLEKAKENGAIDYIKKLKKTRNVTENGTYETVEVELLNSETARKELANYIGIERLPDINIVQIQSFTENMQFIAESKQLTPQQALIYYREVLKPGLPSPVPDAVEEAYEAKLLRE